MVATKRPRTQFRVPNYGAPNRKGVKKRWRKQRGVDNKLRVHKVEAGAWPKIGYKNTAAVRYARPDGSFEMLIHNEKELITMAATKKEMKARFAGSLSARKRIMLQKLADKHGVKVVNRV